MLIELKDVSYVYSKDTVYEVRALDHVNLGIEEGQFIGIIGHTGSGKSTLIQHMNGLMKPTEGQVLYEGEDIWGEKYNLKNLRTSVGLVFQYPENQLFETDVLTDVMFGPKNKGLTPAEAEKRARAALLSVGVAEKYFTTSPFELSGGQKRRVAIAGVLAMDPKVLILDEPTAGLDPQGRDEILGQIRKLHRERGITIVLVSHSMEDVAEYAERIIVVNDGKIPFDGAPREVFSHYKELETMGLAAPEITYVMHELRERGFPVDVNASTVAEAKESILKDLKGGIRRV
ncbi:MAG: energy-coupling factor transporter ATPase [Lachnospiraceae bacterium]|jgi:energy-coupling factor transport system ATP-binding protein|nr:energy-coupling factor transporter ATPase [Lachnospiraceae bacterium]MBR3231946.1 energy-coupling factor transporter ATPase [Lachnospiraceae bacterium]MEE1109114.1 energy-coupling factor transporter ATPase [Lachnospiraceae bacterium]MEE3377653.1 energy-coupling factor transporter ATPase [Lachnospiraceae bacterium]MEE3437456.1 energy-coupling factor transporter ATPase [Lachnospiraceae bacterium]